MRILHARAWLSAGILALALVWLGMLLLALPLGTGGVAHCAGADPKRTQRCRASCSISGGEQPGMQYTAIRPQVALTPQSTSVIGSPTQAPRRSPSPR